MCLTDHTNKIKLENRDLRRELLELIRKTRALQVSSWFLSHFHFVATETFFVGLNTKIIICDACNSFLSSTMFYL